jgi:Flp pilus assembly protein TadG
MIKRNASREGASIIEFMLVIPILLILIGASLDLNLYVSTRTLTENIATDAVRIIRNNPSISEDDFEAQLLSDFPAISNGNGNLTYTVESSQETAAYTHRFTSSAKTRESNLVANPIKVTVKYERDWYTAAGSAWSTVSASTDKISITSVKQATDYKVDSGW